MQHCIIVHISYTLYLRFYNIYIFVIAITIVLKRCALPYKRIQLLLYGFTIAFKDCENKK